MRNENRYVCGYVIPVRGDIRISRPLENKAKERSTVNGANDRE